MKATFNFDDQLIRAAKMRAAEEGQTLTRLIEWALRDYLQAGTDIPGHAFRANLLTKRGRSVAGVNLDDRNVLYEQRGAGGPRARRRRRARLAKSAG